MPLILPSRFNQQPQFPAAIGWGNTLNQGLLANLFSCPIIRYEAARKAPLTLIGTPTSALDERGYSAVFDSGAGAYLASDSSLDLPVNFTLSYRIKITSTPTFHAVLCKGTSGVNYDSYALGIGVTSGGQQKFDFIFRTGNADTPNYQLQQTGYITVNKWFHVAVTHDGSTLSLYIDGVLDATGTGNASGPYVNTSRLFFGGVFDNTPTYVNKQLTYPVQNLNIIRRCLSPVEIKALKENPWQIFKAAPLRIWVSAAGGATTITCSVGNAASTGVKAQISTSTVCAVGNATATGVSAQVSRSVVCSVGNASSTGVSALISPSLVCSVGNAASTGVSALVSNSVVCTVGATTATGVNAFLNLSEVCTVGNAAATGVNATVSTSGTTTITCSVGATAATGVNAQISPSVVCTVGATSATGVNAQISTSTVCAVGATTATGVKAQISASTICTVGNAAATGVNCSITIPGNQTITCTVGNAAAATATALISLGITASVANAAAAGVAATITKAVQCSVGNANATGVSSTIIALTNTTLVCTVGNAIASGVKATLVGFSVSADPVAGSRVVFGTPERRVAIPQFSQTVSRNKAARIFT